MKTISHTAFKGLLVLGFILLTTKALSQTKITQETERVDLDTVQVYFKAPEFNQFISTIISDENFRYRKTLQNAKDLDKQYLLGDITISQANLLKQFKKAARSSDTADGFLSYFQTRDMDFINLIDAYDLERLYSVIRQTTFNGFIDDWQRYY